MFRILAGVLLALALGAGSARADPVHVYVESNAGDATRVLEVRHDPGSPARLVRSLPTGGRGTGAGIETQGAVTTTAQGRRILAVAAGSGEVVVLAPGGRVLSRVPSEGARPVSVVVRGDLVYVLNSGAPANVAGFRLRPAGQLRPLSGARRALSAPDGRAIQVDFTPDGSAIVVSERGTDRLLTFPLDRRGRPGAERVVASAGAGPFGFAFAGPSTLVVSEVGNRPGSISSYRVGAVGELQPVTRALSTGQPATCWVATTPDGRFAYVSNTSAGTISGFAVGRDGALTPVGEPVSTGDATAPTDMAVSPDGAYLYAVYARANAIGVLAIAADGTLTPAQTLSLPATNLNGLSATLRPDRARRSSRAPR